MKVKIPQEIKLGGLVYTVLQGYQFKERADIRGQTDHDMLLIRIPGKPAPQCDKYASQAIEEIFVHELVHLLDFVYNSHALDEEQVLRLAHGLYQLFTDNEFLEV